jgi:hypothetical protein
MEPAKDLKTMINDAHADGKITVQENRNIVNKIAEDGVISKDEKGQYKPVLSKALADNPDAASKAEIVMDSRRVLTDKELLRTIVFAVLIPLGIVVLFAMFNIETLKSIITALLP